MSDGVDSRMDAVQPTDTEAVKDGVAIDAQAQELPPGDHPMLALREHRDPHIRSRLIVGVIIPPFINVAGHGAIVAPRVLRLNARA
jgi:hypothetical protein